MEVFGNPTIRLILLAALFVAIGEWLKSIKGPFFLGYIAAVFSVIGAMTTARATDSSSGISEVPDSKVTSTYTVDVNMEPIAEEMIKTAYAGILAPASDFLFPESSTEYLSYNRLNEVMEFGDRYDMRSISQRAINEIYARYGYTFNGATQTSQEAKDRFEGKDWYEEARKRCTEKDQYKLLQKQFNDYERSNIEAINQWQIDHNVPGLEE